MADQNSRVSYIKKPLAKKSPAALGLAAGSLVCFGVGIAFGVRTQGQIPLNIAAVCFCSLLLSVAGLWFGVLALTEKEKNYILARISLAVCIPLLILWIILILFGLRG